MTVNTLGVQANLDSQHHTVWSVLHARVLNQISSQAGAFRVHNVPLMFLQPDFLQKPAAIFSLVFPMPLTRLRLLMQWCVGSHSLPVGQSRLERPLVQVICASTQCAASTKARAMSDLMPLAARNISTIFNVATPQAAGKWKSVAQHAVPSRWQSAAA